MISGLFKGFVRESETETTSDQLDKTTLRFRFCKKLFQHFTRSLSPSTFFVSKGWLSRHKVVDFILKN
ncbi:hypothetical protein LWI29_026509 [Acer saccharum]|uniref:Uncharacterized protein n=1 Tax=Acer saccharum TaxID=4024 RepID=A0AA39VLK4_ACESA|nr:hypothetical protein LWI29_026509 [Acer saccharum]KAK1568287.1 hypothetical protein Q3G72_022678 [Acer saccharum]